MKGTAAMRALSASISSRSVVGFRAGAEALGDQRFQRFLGFAQGVAGAGGHGDAAADGLLQGAHHMQAGRVALADEAGAHLLDLGHRGELLLHQVGQLQVLEEEVHELFLRQLEDEVVHALAVLASRLAAACPRRRLRAGPPGRR